MPRPSESDHDSLISPFGEESVASAEPSQLATSEIQSPLAVVRADGRFMLLATRPLDAGEFLLKLEGAIRPLPSKYSLQVGAGEHLDVPEGVDLESILDRYPWRSLNHACSPSARIEGGKLIAKTAIAAWGEVTFDYNCTEYDLASPFTCACGSDRCVQLIRGYRWLTPQERAERTEDLAPHLRA